MKKSSKIQLYSGIVCMSFGVGYVTENIGAGVGTFGLLLVCLVAMLSGLDP